MSNRNPISVLRHDPYLEVVELAPASVDNLIERSGTDIALAPGWYIKDAVALGLPPDQAKIVGPFTSRAEAIAGQGRQEFAAAGVPSLLDWRGTAARPIVFPEREVTREGGPTLHDPTVVVGDPSYFFLEESVRIDSFVKLEIGGGLYLGEFVHLASFAHIGIGGGVCIFEDGASAGSGVRVITGSNVYGAGRGCSAVALDAAFSRSFVRVCRNAVLFAGATVLPGVTIGQNAVVAAGSVVLGDVPPFEVWAGNPARFVKRMEWSVTYASN